MCPDFNCIKWICVTRERIEKLDLQVAGSHIVPCEGVTVPLCGHCMATVQGTRSPASATCSSARLRVSFSQRILGRRQQARVPFPADSVCHKVCPSAFRRPCSVHYMNIKTKNSFLSIVLLSPRPS